MIGERKRGALQIGDVATVVMEKSRFILRR